MNTLKVHFLDEAVMGSSSTVRDGPKEY